MSLNINNNYFKFERKQSILSRTIFSKILLSIYFLFKKIIFKEFSKKILNDF